MGGELTSEPDARLRAAMDRIARTLLGSAGAHDRRLGRLTLQPHQVAAVGRLLAIMQRYRGALLADAVGLGKTYVALAIARTFPKAVVICPAGLLPMWERAMATAGMSLRSHSMESLSRGDRAEGDHDLVIVDEAHHFRNAATRRYRSLANLTRRARVLLLSATPLQNSRADLATVLALFAGPAVKGWSAHMTARLIVRRETVAAGQSLPSLSGPHALWPGSDDDCLQAILDVPPAVPAADEGVAQALATLSLVHLWSSSRAALVASVRRRRARAIALSAAIDSGHVPTAAELSAWHYADGALQMAMPLNDLPGGAPTDADLVHSQLEQFIVATSRLLAHCAASPDPDVERVQLLRSLRARHAGARCVAFSQYADTVTGFARLMRADPGTALVTAAGARIASGAIRREEILSQLAGDAAEPRPAERVDLVLTTDLLSEGIDLRRASVIVHLDLPWNPARLEQRVGRARRLGSPHSQIHVYTLMPPAAAERMMELRRRLTAKLRAANVVVGGSAAPFFAPEAVETAPVVSGEEIRRRMNGWLDEGATDCDSFRAGAARASRAGWIATAIVDGSPRMLHDSGEGVGDDPTAFLRALEDIGEPAPVDGHRRDEALRSIEAWIASRRAASGAGEQSPARRTVLERLTAIVGRSARHRRHVVLAEAKRARSALMAIAGAGAENGLAALAASVDDDDAWMRSLDHFIAIHQHSPGHDTSDVVTGLILLG